MKKSIKNCIGCCILTAAVALGAGACSSTMDYSTVKNYTCPIPNADETGNFGIEAVQGEVPPDKTAEILFYNLHNSNIPAEVQVGRALARLPEMNDGFTKADADALYTITKLLKDGNSRSKKLLVKMAAENPEHNQYSASLQGLVWMIQDCKFQEAGFGWTKPEDYVEYAWKSLPDRISSPEDVAEYLSGNFSYLPDLMKAHAKKDFFARKFGDCTEFVMLGGYLLDKLGYDTYVLFTKPTAFGHHVSLVFESEEGFYLLDGSRITLNQVLRKKDPKNFEYTDKQVWKEIEPFDHIFGPEPKVPELVRLYARQKDKKLPYRLLPFDEYESYIEANGHENTAWYQVNWSYDHEEFKAAAKEIQNDE